MSPLLAMRLIAALERAAGSPEVPTPALLKAMWFAAQQKAHGASWEAIARGLGRGRPETCRRWTQKFAPYWTYLFNAAFDRLVLEAGEEARVRLGIEEFPPLP